MVQQIIVMSGLPGSGKSVVAEGIAAKLSIPIFSVDHIESAVIQAGIPKSFETGLAAYSVASELAGEQLKQGSSVIIDAVNAEEEGKNIWRQSAQDTRVPLTIIEVTVNEAEHKKRIESRVRALPGLPEVTWPEVQQRREAYTQWAEPILRLDSALAPSTLVQSAIEYIETVR